MSPVPFVMRKHAPKHASYGLNFAFGGTGVFDTLVSAPNKTTQIDFLQNLVNQSVYAKSGLQSSLRYVSVAGNDYSTYYAKGGSAKGLPAFIASVVKQIAVNLKRIHDMGVGKVAVGALQPLGCLPGVTILNNFQQCNETSNTRREIPQHVVAANSGKAQQ
ncbi:GDSL esterase/lipase At5g03610-like [Rhododendron vialii]|uniref:GDSL esterase/lipase At5g03610-like n=1 Tax=Rhododendron vialii TaxID=182163 RepID=UPI00265E2F3E|nr:GDSL esterase/lipase At5g03610-like [Rhododendron vialii]